MSVLGKNKAFICINVVADKWETRNRYIIFFDSACQTKTEFVETSCSWQTLRIFLHRWTLFIRLSKAEAPVNMCISSPLMLDFDSPEKSLISLATRCFIISLLPRSESQIHKFKVHVMPVWKQWAGLSFTHYFCMSIYKLLCDCTLL